MDYRNAFIDLVGQALERPCARLLVTPTVAGLTLGFAGEPPALTVTGAKAVDAVRAAVKGVTGLDIVTDTQEEWTSRKRLFRHGNDGSVTLVAAGTPSPFGDIVALDLALGTGRVALAIGRFQPPHNGHVGLFRRMLGENDIVIVGVGSTQHKHELRHPFAWEQRRAMLACLFGKTLRIVPLTDLDSLDTTDEWVAYVIGKLAKQRLPEPTDYYTGSPADAKWYVGHFARLTDPVVRGGDRVTTHQSPVTGRRLHVVARDPAMPVSASDLRSLIERRDPDWKQWVPAGIVDDIERSYPGHLRIALRRTGDFPRDVPLGTAVIRTDYTPEMRFELVRSGWQPVRPSRQGGLCPPGVAERRT